MNKILVTFILSSLIVFGGCSPDNEPPLPDVSQIIAPLELVRFDRVLFDIDTTDIPAEFNRLSEEYGEFADIYLKNIEPIRRADFGPEEQVEVMKAFIRYPAIRRLDSIVQNTFSDQVMEEHKQSLQQALKYYRYYLPEAPIPDTLVSYVSEFTFAGLLYGDGNLAAGLEFYLGPDFDYSQVSSQEAIFSEYLTHTYRPEYLTQKLMQVLIQDYVPRPRAGRLIDYIIYEGKKLFLLDRVLPQTPNEIVYEVSEDQMDWLEENEIAIYAHLQEQNEFYSTSADLIRKLTQPAPYTQGMPRESPGRAVNYLGKKIIDAFVSANPQVTMGELLQMTDGQKVLAAARFKPK